MSSTVPAAGLRLAPDVANPAGIVARNDSHMRIIRGATERGAVGGE